MQQWTYGLYVDDVVLFIAAYATQWEELLNEQLAVLAQARDLVAEFRAKMTHEEHISRRIMPRH